MSFRRQEGIFPAGADETELDTFEDTPEEGAGVSANSPKPAAKRRGRPPAGAKSEPATRGRPPAKKRAAKSTAASASAPAGGAASGASEEGYSLRGRSKRVAAAAGSERLGRVSE